MWTWLWGPVVGLTIFAGLCALGPFLAWCWRRQNPLEAAEHDIEREKARRKQAADEAARWAKVAQDLQDLAEKK